MDHLYKKTCAACHAGAPLATAEEITAYLQEIPNWQLLDVNGVQQLTRCYQFNDFNGAIAFTHKIGIIAENQGHHPTILTEWGKVTVYWWSHKIKGLHINDFIMAARTDSLFST